MELAGKAPASSIKPVRKTSRSFSNPELAIPSTIGDGSQDQNRFKESGGSDSGSEVDNDPPIVKLEKDLAVISVKQLNHMLQGYDKSTVSMLKQKRRTLKNRGYAHKCRIKRINIQAQLEMENAGLKSENERIKTSLFNSEKQVESLQRRLSEISGFWGGGPNPPFLENRSGPIGNGLGNKGGESSNLRSLSPSDDPRSPASYNLDQNSSMVPQNVFDHYFLQPDQPMGGNNFSNHSADNLLMLDNYKVDQPKPDQQRRADYRYDQLKFQNQFFMPHHQLQLPGLPFFKSNSLSPHYSGQSPASTPDSFGSCQDGGPMGMVDGGAEAPGGRRLDERMVREVGEIEEPIISKSWLMGFPENMEGSEQEFRDFNTGNSQAHGNNGPFYFSNMFIS